MTDGEGSPRPNSSSSASASASASGTVFSKLGGGGKDKYRCYYKGEGKGR